MADRKKQHYVPKLYLKFFSINDAGNEIGLYNFSNEIFRPRVGLKNQAKEDYFYGKDGFLEEQLSKLEGIAAPVLKDIILTNNLPDKSDPNYSKLFTFSMVTAQRTKDVAEQIKEMTDKIWRKAMSYDDRFKDKIEDLRIYLENPAAMALMAVTERLHLGMDLKLKLLVNKTDLNFITSDHPVVKYNQFLEQRKHPGGNVGLSTKGLQIFFPISPIHMLCYYDDWIYKIGDRTKNVVNLTAKDDVAKLNYLQALNCLDHLYFNQTHEMDIKKEKSKVLAAFISGIGLILGLCRILKKKSLTTMLDK